ncbi:MAG TPA: hypothetical protein VF956_12520 [Candidatus Dormibacteraeota bacterium]
MIQDAVISIRRADEEAMRRRHALRARRRPIQLLDHWLSQVESLIERNDAVVPEPLVGEIARFLGKLNPRLHRRLRRNGRREAVRVLDVLFEAEEEFLPTTPEGGQALR